MLRDSFTSHLAPFVSEHFRRAVYLWQRSFDYEVIEREKPDVVIEEFGERMRRSSTSPDERLVTHCKGDCPRPETASQTRRVGGAIPAPTSPGHEIST
jgi:hypothetical protein